MAVIHKQKASITAASGSGTATILAASGVMKQIFVKSATSTTTFDVKLTDVHSLDIYETTAITGVLNEMVDMPSYGNYTLTISNASADEELTYLLTFIEQF